MEQEDFERSEKLFEHVNDARRAQGKAPLDAASPEFQSFRQDIFEAEVAYHRKRPTKGDYRTAFEKALKEAKIGYQIFIYEGAQHAFNNDSNPDRYHKEAAELAWTRTVAFFKEKLKS